MLYNNLRKFIKKFPVILKILTWSKDRLLNLSRLKDVLMMMLLFHVWPEQTYRFSTRKLLPSKKNRFSKESKPVIPYDLLKSNGSNIPLMKEINIIGRGSSFDLNDIKKIKGLIFLISFLGPLKISDNGNLINNHIFSYESGKFIGFYESGKFIGWKTKFTNEDLEEYMSGQAKDKDKNYVKKNITYVISQSEVLIPFKKNGYNNLLSVEIYMTDKDGNYHPQSKEWGTDFYRNLFDNENCRYISLVEKVYKPPLLKPHPSWAPTGSFLPAICALSNFAEKINIYGWDFYLPSSPAKMNYWQLFFSMYKYKYDVYRSKNHFESALINFYYGYQLSKLPNFNIHGYMGQLDKHKKRP